VAAKKQKKDDNSEGTSPFDQLVEVAKGLSDDDITFLVKQARMMMYNQKVDELNAAAEQLNATRWQTQSGKAKTKEASKPRPAPGLVEIERGSFGRSYILVIRNQRKTIDEHEMTKLVKIAHDAEDERDGVARLFRWLQRSRDDVILDAGLSVRDPAMRELLKVLRTKFTISET